jgi:beta-glucosidase
MFGEPLEIRFHWVTPEQREENIKKAVKLASSVDVPIVFGHANSPAQVGMQLIEGFDELIQRVAEANPKTVVVLHNADRVLMPWLDKVSAVLGWVILARKVELPSQIFSSATTIPKESFL